MDKVGPREGIPVAEGIPEASDSHSSYGSPIKSLSMLRRAAWLCLTSRRPSSRPPCSFSHDTEPKLFHCACVQDGSIAFVVLEVTADRAAIHGTMTACVKAWLRVVVLVLFCFARLG